ncbi:choice-of-anchor J domain-containing protein [Fulvivirgaceae bacterium BMA10]|uniref:Choice-of-anchor J domain-containing protein n=1 Tax=Splendidivirga corallicola TaxID=3051826 RepID=A0ABT8KT99_9BACT|nr:choice-of-anchor J domain-containing protein [Fulvivirgaceae bacterium BMA10]
MRKSLVFIFLLHVGSILLAQEKCGTVLLEEIKKQNNPSRESIHQFEDWLQNKIKDRKFRSSAQGEAERQAGPYIIPVVVHVIHLGEPVGTGSNISDDQIISQIDVLNEDFRRLNSDANLTLSQFKPVAADAEIEFRLAQRDPEGLATTGITRTLSTRAFWGINDGEALSSLSYWPAEDYLNIWVTNLSGTLLGFAQLPVSNLEGLEDASNNRLSDGIVVRYESFGSVNKGDFPVLEEPFHLGRTTTHEVGHFFGLRHIWGDGGCSVDDFCADTPQASSDNNGCNLNKTSCGGLNMVQNYMDYTDDVCMNLFTLDQKARMQTVLENSPRRESLTESKGALPPVVTDNDLGIRGILSPNVGVCDNNTIPSVEVRNYGTNQITSLSISVILNENVIETKNVVVTLDPLEITTISFNPLSITEIGKHQLGFEVSSVNGSSDNNPDNNNQEMYFFNSANVTSSFSSSFEILPVDWIIDNPDGETTWAIQNAQGNGSDNNTAIAINMFNYQSPSGETDRLITPNFDLSSVRNASIRFKIAYADNENRPDKLAVAVSRDCGNTFSEQDIIYQKSGNELSTTNSSTSAFVPTNKFQWRTENIDLSEFIGEENIQIAFMAQNGEGNNLFLDDVGVAFQVENNYDISISKITKPSPIICDGNIAPSIEVINLGTESVNTFEVSLKVNGNVVSTLQYSGDVLAPDAQTTIDFDNINLPDGSNEVTFSVGMPNGVNDKNQGNNEKSITTLIENSNDILPIREKFKTSQISDSDWIVINPDMNTTWEVISAPNGETNNFSAYINQYDYPEIGQKNWLVSPVLDFSKTDKASLTFRISHASTDNFADTLKVLVSTDCGTSFEQMVFSRYGVALAQENSQDPWTPSSANDWREEFIDLTDFAGEPNVRVAFVAVNGYSNNLYLDDIEFFLTNTQDLFRPNEDQAEVYPNPVFNGTIKTVLNLSERQEVIISVYDALGKLNFQRNFPNSLNQTYEIDLTNLRNGMYYVSIQGQTTRSVKKIIFNK